MRLVLDTNVVLSALLWEGLPKRLLTAVRVQRALLFSSPPLIAELADVLSRRRLEKKIAASLLSRSQLVGLYAAWAVSVQPLPTPRLVSDPDDDVVIGTALAAKADLIVTGDKALLLVAKYDGGRIVSVAEALRILTLG